MKHYPLELKRDLRNGLVITGLIALVALALRIIGLSTGVFDPVGQAISDFHISDGLFYAKALQEKNSGRVNSGVVIVDIKDCDSREQIADIVDYINACSPKLLAVDIIFGKTPALCSGADSLLVAAFKKSPKLILASRYVPDTDGGHVERSFFADELCCLEGDVSFDLGKVRSFSPGGDYPSMVALIAKEGGITDAFNPQLVNYTPVNTICLSAEALNDPSLLKDQIVILGDKGDYRDFHDIPVIIDGQPRTPGVNIIAQCLYTLRPGNGFKDSPQWLDLLLGLVLTFLFCTFVSSPLFRVGLFNGFWISLFQILAMIVMLVVHFALFWGLHLNVSLTYWFIGVGFSGLATELFYFIFRRNNESA